MQERNSKSEPPPLNRGLWPTPLPAQRSRRQLPSWLDWLLAVLMLAFLTGCGFLAWWLIDSVHGR